MNSLGCCTLRPNAAENVSLIPSQTPITPSMKPRLFNLARLSAIVLVALFAGRGLASDHEAIEEAMKKFHKAPKGTDPICKKIAKGEGTEEQLAGILKAYEGMLASKPPQGDEAEWKKKCEALITAIKDVQAGKDGALAAYGEAVNCKACHKDFKPD